MKDYTTLKQYKQYAPLPSKEDYITAIEMAELEVTESYIAAAAKQFGFKGVINTPSGPIFIEEKET